MLGGFKPKLWGITSVGERGQVVIPAKARQSLKLEKGEKLLVLSKKDTIILVKEKMLTNQIRKWLSEIEKFKKE